MTFVATSFQVANEPRLTTPTIQPQRRFFNRRTARTNSRGTSTSGSPTKPTSLNVSSASRLTPPDVVNPAAPLDSLVVITQPRLVRVVVPGLVSGHPTVPSGNRALPRHHRTGDACPTEHPSALSSGAANCSRALRLPGLCCSMREQRPPSRAFLGSLFTWMAGSLLVATEWLVDWPGQLLALGTCLWLGGFVGLVVFTYRDARAAGVGFWRMLGRELRVVLEGLLLV